MEGEPEDGSLAGGRAVGTHRGAHDDPARSVPGDPESSAERCDPQVPGLAGAACITDARRDRAHAERLASSVADDDDEPLALTRIQARDVAEELEAGRAAAVACSERTEGRRRSKEGAGRQEQGYECGRAQLHTTTTALLGLSGPRQFVPAAGVTVYCHEPDTTPVSVHVSTVSVPEHPLVAPTPTPVATL